MLLANKKFIGVISAALIAGVAAFEGTKTQPYYDIANIPTVCTGHTGKDIDMDKLYTIEECRSILVKDLQKHSKDVLECIQTPIKQSEYDAYTMFAFNVGVNSFCASRANKLLSQGQHIAACNALSTSPNGQPAWSYAAGKYVPGLQSRRLYERDMCLKDLK